MQIKVFLSLILAFPTALAVRDRSDVRNFLVTPPAECNVGGVNVCKVTSETVEVCPGGKTYCSGACGTWAGEEGTCCSGPPGSSDSYLKGMLTACKPYADTLKSKGSPPLTEGCSDTTKFYMTGGDDDSCCPIEDDIVTVYSDHIGTVESRFCVKLGDGKKADPSSGSTSTSTSANPGRTTSTSSESASSSKKDSLGAAVTPGAAAIVASCVIATIAGMATFGML